MSDTKWRISGGIGVPEEPAQVMTQGLGFPLRPVDGVPAQDSGEYFDDLLIAEAIFMAWVGEYQAGYAYPPGYVVLDEDWTCISKVLTVSKPAPQLTGAPTYGLPTTPAFVTQDELAVIYSGHTYTFLQTGWVSRLRVWVPSLSEDTNYRVIALDITDPNKIIARIQEEPVLVAGQWNIIGLAQKIARAGDKWLVYVDALDSGASVGVNGGWTFNGVNQSGPPLVNGWNHDNQNIIVRISSTDLDGTDRTSELAGMGPATTINFADTDNPNRSSTYTVTGAPTNNTTYFSYPVRLESTGPSGTPGVGETTTMSASVPTPQTTEYSEIVGGVTSTPWATVEGFLQFDGVDQVGDANAYGVDLEFDEAVINPEWDIITFADI